MLVDYLENVVIEIRDKQEKNVSKVHLCEDEVSCYIYRKEFLIDGTVRMMCSNLLKGLMELRIGEDSELLTEIKNEMLKYLDYLKEEKNRVLDLTSDEDKSSNENEIRIFIGYLDSKIFFINSLLDNHLSNL